jgi:hypothetical protein
MRLMGDEKGCANLRKFYAHNAHMPVEWEEF